ncbi:hypothetical protein ACJMK2_021537 [Sinanodonta woodiana]|uniref:Uncharacterized protein n=1 Tax=Sinanodonta woodiana TaxID=1069815 RepID=A0ABD3TGD0_SINWO
MNMVIVLVLLVIPDLPVTQGEQWTAGRTKCRGGALCARRQNPDYSWCYTDYSGGWDYCCTAECTYVGDTLKCASGSRSQYCGNTRTLDIEGRPCLPTFPCGVHYNELKERDFYYWCYVDLNANWGFCCAPHSKCEKGTYSSAWCYIGADRSNKGWDYCKPEDP